MRIAVLWSHMSGYLNACLQELANINDVKLFVSNYAASSAAPFRSDQFTRFTAHCEWPNDVIDKKLLLANIDKFDPDVLLVSGWHHPEYRFVLHKYRDKALKVLVMDNPWRGTPKQWLGVITAPWYIRPIYDVAFVAGERQAQFARRFGFKENHILKGVFSCDHDAFSSVYHARGDEPLPGTFIFVGRFSPEKGIETLVKGYQHYRRLAPHPWPLICCGVGPLRPLLENKEGIIIKGFVQPRDLPDTLKQASCLLLPSQFEPWGLVVHEAASAGLAVICSSSCGASVHLVQDGYNGYLIDAGDSVGLGEAMFRFASLSDARRKETSVNSYSLSSQFTPKRWATYFYERALEMQQRQNG